MHARISAIEYYLPDNCISNEDLQAEFPDYDFSNFEIKVGITKRCIVNQDETALDIAIYPCQKIFEKINKDEIDFLLYCTQSPDYFLPTTACILQNMLGLKKNIGAFDFNLGCSGYTYGLSVAKALVTSGQAKNVLLVTSETYSKYLHKKDRSNRSIFGDASTATLISQSETDDIGNFYFGTDGSGFDKLIVKNGAARNKYEQFAKEVEFGTNNVYTDNHLFMNGPEVFNFSIEVIPGFVKSILEKNQIDIQNIDQYIFHQANKFMLNILRQKLVIEEKKFYIGLSNTGNTVSNTIPIALKKYSEMKQDNVRERLMLVGFGVGLSWCGGIININNSL